MIFSEDEGEKNQICSHIEYHFFLFLYHKKM